jgi:hypothetical protein
MVNLNEVIMTKKLAFDTLKYAKFLTEGGVEHADVHSEGLAKAITQNFYTKNEVEKMFDMAIKQFEERSHQMREEFKESLIKFDERTNQVIHEIRKDSHRLELEIKEIGNQTVNRLTRNIGIMIAIFTLIEILLHTKILG